ncbi:vesicle transport protein GOT1A [Cottoperca gobio]|uniref:Vesicle transport protein GOT1A n=1 Tax=Cottoperca gobio TaxID=56716 RepID=A0A6J2PSI8_COTGO|nr:vesicle transport protein GOT1A-like [Cottoperca gobio]
MPLKPWLLSSLMEHLSEDSLDKLNNEDGPGEITFIFVSTYNKSTESYLRRFLEGRLQISCQLQEIGIGLMGFGLFFLLFGVLLYFDSVLLAFGNILFMAGLTFIIGFRRTAHFFFQRQKFRGSLFFLGGVSLVLCRWPIIGMLVESYGFVLLFRSFFPMVLGFLLSAVNIPFLNTLLPSSSSMV